MFEELLYLLRCNGLRVSLTEWMALMEGLHKTSTTPASPAFTICAAVCW